MNSCRILCFVKLRTYQQRARAWDCYVNAPQLIERLAKLRPSDEPSELLRMGLLLSLQHSDSASTPDEAELERRCEAVSLQLSATSDQHAAVAEELDSLAATAPCDFSPEHLWTLVRAIKVQNQILNLYLGSSQAES